MSGAPNLAWLRSFEAAARHLSFTNAARELNMTQAGLSKQVRLLELYLGEALFVRKARSLELTKLGAAYYPKVQDGLQRLKDGTEEIFSRSRKPRLTLKVIESFAISWLVPRLKSFEALAPEVELRILSSNWAFDGNNDAFDFEISYGFDNAQTLPAERLTYEKVTPVVAPRNAPQFQTPHDLIGQRLIHVIGYQEGWTKWLSENGISEGFASIQADSSRIAYALAKEGIGVALGRSSLVAGELEAGRLVAPFESWVPIDEGFFLIQHKDALSSPAKAFREWVLSQKNRDIEAG